MTKIVTLAFIVGSFYLGMCYVGDMDPLHISICIIFCLLYLLMSRGHTTRRRRRFLQFSKILRFTKRIILILLRMKVMR